MSQIRPIVLFIPMSLFLVSAAWSIIDLDGFFALARAGNNWILDTFSTVFAVAVFGFVLTCVWVFLSPLSQVRIGGPAAKPILTRWSWFSITLCTTIAIGILFWGMAEPMFHLYDSGARDLEPGSPAAENFSLVSLFMHWAISPYAIYTVPSLAFALAFHNFKTPNSVAGPLSILFGRPLPRRVSDLLDAAILLALILGMAASLGAGMLLLAGGIGKLTGWTTSTASLGLIAAAIVGLVLLSSLTGLLRGIRILSDINTKFFFGFVAFVFLFGPTGAIIVDGARAIGGYVAEFVPRSFVIGVAGDREWANAWTIFYWANWLAWAPVTAMFLGRIAVGYTVREFITMNLIIPAFFSIVWMSVFGVFAMKTDEESAGALKAALEAAGPEAVAFEAISFLPLGGFIIVVLLFLSFISYVTAADSNTEAIKMICQRDGHLTTGKEDTPSGESPRAGALLKISWMVLLGSTAWIMTAYSGIDGVRMLSNLGGFPALFIVLLLNFTLLKLTGKDTVTRLSSVPSKRVPSPAP